MKKIAFFINNMNNGGGTERVTALIANGLASRGFEVWIISSKNGLEPHYDINDDVKLISLQSDFLPYSSKTRKIIDYFKRKKNLKKIVETYRIDLIISVDIALFKYFKGLNKNCKTIAWEHFNILINRGRSVERTRNFAVKNADKIIVLGKEDLKEYKKRYPKANNICCIYNPIAYKIENVIDISNQVIIAAGRLEEQKGFDLLIDIWNKVEPKANNWTLKIFGEGSQRDLLQSKIDNYGLRNVKLLGYCSDLETEMKNSSIFVLSSRFEGFVLVLLEAQAKGLPCISFNCKMGPSEIITDGVNGFLIEENDIDKFADKLLYLICNKDCRKQFSLNSQKDLNRFNTEIIISEWGKLIDSLFKFGEE